MSEKQGSDISKAMFSEWRNARQVIVQEEESD